MASNKSIVNASFFPLQSPPIPIRVVDLTGQVCNFWTVLRFAGIYRQIAWWHCQCICGMTDVLSTPSLRRRYHTSCGCQAPERPKNTRHGLSKHPLLHTYVHLRKRCLDPTSPSYKAYGGRGITLCKRWKDGDGNLMGIACFVADMGTKPSPTHSIDRIDNNGGYWCGHCDECVELGHPANCRWATPSMQANNTRRNRRFTYQGKTQSMLEWSKELHISERTLWSRLLQMKWSVEKTLSTPVRGRPNKGALSLLLSLMEADS